MRFELYGENKVKLSPGGYYDLNQDNNTELMVVKLSLLQAHITAAIEHIAETSEEPKAITNGSDIMKLADTIFAKYQKDIELGNKDLFENKNVFVNKDYDHMHPNAKLEFKPIKPNFHTTLTLNRCSDMWPVRISNIMKNAQIVSMDDLLNKSAADLLKFRNMRRKDINIIRSVLSDYGLALAGDPTQPHPLDGWKPAKDCNTIEGAEYEKMYGGINNMSLYQMTIAEREGKYIPYHGGIAMPECETISQAAKAIDAYYNELPPEHKYSHVEEPQLYKFQIIGYEEPHSNVYLHGLGTIDDKNQFCGHLKHEDSIADLSKLPLYYTSSDPDIAWNYANTGFSVTSVEVYSLPITNITLVQKQDKTPTFPALTPTEAKELSNFTAVVKNHFPEVPTGSIYKLCTIASDMTKLTIQNANGTLSNEKYNVLTDSQEKQVKELVKDLPHVTPVFSYNEKLPAIELKIPSRQSDVENCIADNSSVYKKVAVPEIPKNKLKLPQEPAKGPEQTKTNRR